MNKNNTIYITLKSKKDYTNKFNNERISSELTHYILDECKTIPTSKKIFINIENEFNMNREEQKQFREMLKNSYYDDLIELKNLKKRFLVVDLLSFLFGILILISYYYINSNIDLLSEVTLIIGWVLIWEAIYNILFSQVKNEINILRHKQIIKSTINFIN